MPGILKAMLSSVQKIANNAVNSEVDFLPRFNQAQRMRAAKSEIYLSLHLRMFRKQWPLVLITVCYALSRALFYDHGGRFSSFQVDFWQFLDTNLLKHQLWTSVFYLHSQPPLMNLYYGILFQAFPRYWPVVAYNLNILVGLLAFLAIYTVMTRNKVPRNIALWVVIIAFCNPSDVIFEAEPFYTHTVFCLLVFAAYFFEEYLRQPGIGTGALFLGVVTTLVLWRAAYQLVWYVLIAFWLVKVTPPRLFRKVVVLALLFGGLIGCLYLKNGILFGSFNSSSASGMSLAKSWAGGPRVAPFMKEGKLSPISNIPAPNSMEKYLPVIGPLRKTGVKAVDSIFKDSDSMSLIKSGIPGLDQSFSMNLNNIGYPEVSRLYTKDFMRLVKLSPKIIAEQVSRGWLDYFRPTSVWTNWFDTRNQASVESVDRWYRSFFCMGAERTLDISILSDPRGSQVQNLLSRLRAVCWETVVVYAVLALFLVSTPFQRMITAKDNSQWQLLLFCISTIAYSAVLGNAVEIMENMRYRYESQGLVLIAATIIGCAVFRSVRFPSKAVRTGIQRGKVV